MLNNLDTSGKHYSESKMLQSNVTWLGLSIQSLKDDKTQHLHILLGVDLSILLQDELGISISK